MNNSNQRRNRKSIRLRGYDYSSNGYYFITICTHNRENIFGDIIDGKMRLNQCGQIAYDEWFKSAEIRDEIELGEFVVMPNHIHGIVIIRMDDRVIRSPQSVTNGPKPKSIGAMMAGYKSAVTTKMNFIHQTAGKKIWQRNYYDHIIRENNEYERIVEYIKLNPKNWIKDAQHRDSENAKHCLAFSGESYV